MQTLTSPPLCLTPDLQASRIANIMLSATALPSAYSPGPSAPLPFFRHASDRKRGINSIEVELDEANKKRREKIMRMMQRGSSTKAKETIVGPSTHAPSFSRMSFVERWRTLKATNEANAGKMPERGLGELSGSMLIDDKAPSTTTKKKTKKKKAAPAAAAAAAPPAAEEDAAQTTAETKESTPPASTPAKKKPKKKAQREKEEREKAEKEQAEREAAAEAAAAAAKVKEEETPKKGKKKGKKEKEQEAQQAAAALTATTPTASTTDTPSTTKKQPTKKTSKAKKAKVEPSPATTNATLSGDSSQSNGNLVGMSQAQTPIMYPQQMSGYPMMNQNLATVGLNGSPLMPAAFTGQFGNNQVITPQQQQLQQAAIQRVLQAQQLQHQQQQQQQQAAQQPGGGMNSNFMMSAPQIQQHFQALMQQQQLRQQQQQQQQQVNGLSMSPSQQQGQFGGQDSLPVGVGLGNLPPNWNGMG